MQRSRRVVTVALLLAALAGPSSCGGGGDAPSEDAKTLTYHTGLRLDMWRSASRREGSLRVEQLTYTSVDGQRVPALLAVPTGKEPLGCVIYQGGFGTRKEEMPGLRSGMAALRLATFTIDPRNVGARGSPERAKDAVKDPRTLLAMLLNTVVDLRIALDYLERRPDCKANIGFVGTSFGGAVGTLLAAQDPRISASVLTSIGATFEQTLLAGPSAAKRIPGVPQFVPGAATNRTTLARAVKVLAPYDLERWIGKIAPRPVMIINGRFDPLVVPIDALELAAAANSPKTVVYFNGGHDPFADGPDRNRVLRRTARFLVKNLGLPVFL